MPAEACAAALRRAPPRWAHEALEVCGLQGCRVQGFRKDVEGLQGFEFQGYYSTLNPKP